MIGSLGDFICFLLRARPTREQAGNEARRLGVRLDWARFYFENVRR